MLLRSFLAIAGGFASIVLSMGVVTPLTRWLAPSLGALPPSRMARGFNLIVSSLFAASGGCVAALLAPVSPLMHSLILAIVVLLVATMAANELRGVAHGIYPLALAVVPPMATLAGGILTVLYR